MKFFLSILFLLFLLGGITNIGAQDLYETDSQGVKRIGPVDMVSPSANELAMEAYNIGTELMYQNRLAQAEIYLREAIDLDPEFVDAIDHLGLVYRRQNRLEEAEDMYLRSIKLNDKNKVPLINLAVVYRMQDRLNDALQLYQRVIQIDQDDPESYYGIGELFYLVGNYELSMPFFDKALELYISQNSSLVYDVYFYKGIIHYNRSEFSDAFWCLELARIGNPNNETIERLINEIRRRQ